jgi:hypothetical protein
MCYLSSFFIYKDINLLHGLMVGNQLTYAFLFGK